MSSSPVSGSDALSVESLCAGIDVPESVLRFEHVPGGEVVFGPGKLAVVGEKARALGARRVLLVTDPGLRKAGHEERCLEYLRDAGLDVFVFDQAFIFRMSLKNPFLKQDQYKL